MSGKYISTPTIFLLLVGWLLATGELSQAQSPLERLKKNLPDGKDKNSTSKNADTGKVSTDGAQAVGSKDEYKTLAAHQRALAMNLINDIERDSISERRDVLRLRALAERLDYANTKARLEAGLAKYPDLAKEHSVKDFLQGIPAQFTKSANLLLSQTKAFIESAYQKQSRNKLEAAEMAESAVIYADLVLSIQPDNAQARALKKDAEAAIAKVGGAIAATTHTSPFHKANSGKIVFFKSPPTVKQEERAGAAGEFKAADHIYAIAYLKGSLKELVQYPSRELLAGLRYRLFIDGNEHVEYGGFRARVTWETYQDPGTTYLLLDLVPDPDAIDYQNPFHYDPTIKYTKVLGQASPRRHRIELKLEGDNKFLAEGAFSIDLSAGQERLLAVAEKLYQEKLTKVFLPKPAMVNAALGQSMLEAMKANGWKQQLLRLVITEAQWNIHRNAAGVILFRSLNTATAVKEADGRCRYFSISFKQPHLGGGRYGKTEQYGVGDNLDMACANVNKF
jgi:hypothetical protein